ESGPIKRTDACSCHGLAIFGLDRQLHLEGCTFAERRLNPNAAAMHLDDLLGDGEPETSATSGLGQRAVDLVELLEDASSLVIGNAWPRIGHADVEVVVDRLGTHTHLAGIGELDGVADEDEEHLREALLVAEANR